MATEIPWGEVRSKNFRIIGRDDAGELNETATKLEQFRNFFERIFPLEKSGYSPPTNVIVFPDSVQFRDFKPVEGGRVKNWVAGYFLPGEEINYIALAGDSDPRQTYRIIFHEYAHYLLEESKGGGRFPLWFKEGLAEYCEGIELSEPGRAVFGLPNKSHQALLKKGERIPWDVFFQTDSEKLNQMPESRVGLFYAQAWAVFHFLMHGTTEGDRSVPSLLKIFSKGPRNADPEKINSFKNPAGMATGIEIYLLRKNLPTRLLEAPDLANSKRLWQKYSISENQVLGFQGDLLYRLNKLKMAEEVLEKSLSDGGAGSARSLAVSGLVKMRTNDFTRARSFLKKSVELEPDNYLYRYYLAFVITRQGADENGTVRGYLAEDARLIWESLEKAIELNPQFPNSYDLFAFTGIVQNEKLEESLELIQRALEINPENQKLRLRIGEIYSKKREFEKARRLVGEIFQNPDDGQIEKKAEYLLEKIDFDQKQWELVKQRNREKNPYAFESDEPLTEERREDLNRRIVTDSINRNLRKKGENEKRITGKIAQIQCRSGAVFYSVTTEQGQMVFSTPGFNKLLLFTYDINLKGGQIDCGSDLSRTLAIITYIPETEKGSEVAGKIVSIEFVPEYFKLVEVKEKEN
ncbi:MAG: hypothetical protein R2747_04435 [Pyrinomonadaceae bacterium]